MKVNFDGGDLTSDAGRLLYKEFDHKLGFSEAIKEKLVIHDSVIHRAHPNSDVALQKIYQHIAGYHTDDHADDLYNEPLLATLLGKNASLHNQHFNDSTLTGKIRTMESIIFTLNY